MPILGESTTEPPTGGRAAAPYVTPLVRRLATELAVDLGAITGSGVGNRIRKVDVLAAADAARTASRVEHDSVDATDPVGPTANPYLSPLVTMIVAEHALDVSSVHGSGHNRRVRAPDLSRHRSANTSLRPDRVEKLTRLRSVIATRMVESLQMSAQVTTVVEVDVTAINKLRAHYGSAFSAVHGVKLSFTSFFLRTVVDVIAAYPAFNASIDTTTATVTYFGAINLNVAVDTDRGLLAPVIRQADTLDIAQMAKATARLAERARRNELSVDELAGGTFTVTNIGSRGALFDTPIINQPQTAILGTGAVVARATVTRDDSGNEAIDIRDMVYLALTYDHRLIDGADAARFLTAVKARLETADFSQEIVGRLTTP